MSTKKYLTLEEAARQLGMAPDELVRLRERGEIRGFADRGTWKFRSEDVEEFARSRDADSSPEVPIIDDNPGRKSPAAGDSGIRKGERPLQQDIRQRRAAVARRHARSRRKGQRSGSCPLAVGKQRQRRAAHRRRWRRGRLGQRQRRQTDQHRRPTCCSLPTKVLRDAQRQRRETRRRRQRQRCPSCKTGLRSQAAPQRQRRAPCRHRGYGHALERKRHAADRARAAARSRRQRHETRRQQRFIDQARQHIVGQSRRLEFRRKLRPLGVRTAASPSTRAAA